MSQRFLNYARLVRLPNVFTAMADIGLAAFATGAFDTDLGRVVVLLLASSCLYLSGMVWNDYFDVNQDKRERPFRPLASGKISLRSAFVLGTLLMGGGLMLAGVADWEDGALRWRSLTVAMLLVVAILLYDGWLKRTWAGPLAMSSCRSLNVVLGLTATAAAIPAHGWLLALVVGVYIAGVTWFARTEAKTSNVQSLTAAALVMLAGVALGLGVPALAQQTSPTHAVSFWFPYLLVAFGFVVGLPVVRAIRRPIPEKVQPAVKRAVLGLVLLDAVLASALVGLWGLSLALLLAPASIIGRRIYST